MNIQLETTVPVITVFLQGLLSFLSPCVLPLVPLYLGYLAGGGSRDGEGRIVYPRGKTSVNSLFFVIGISFTFFLLGFGFTALGQFFNHNRMWFARVSGIIMIFFGIYQLGVLGKSMMIEKEHRLGLSMEKRTAGPVGALLLGFTFSFAWTPCVGPILGSVVLMAGTSDTMGKAAILIGVYAIGFGIPFLLVGLFTSSVLGFLRRKKGILKYTVKIAAVLMIFMGAITMTGMLNGVTGYLSKVATQSISETKEPQQDSRKAEIKSDVTERKTDISDAAKSETDASKNASDAAKSETDASKNASDASKSQSDAAEQKSDLAEADSGARDKVPMPDFKLMDQDGVEHTMADYKGKVVFLNFWATWCPPCRAEMPDIQALYEKYGGNAEEVAVLGIAAPGIGQEGDTEHIRSFLSEQGYTYPVLMDEGGSLQRTMGIYSFPTTFMVDKDGNLFGQVVGGMTAATMESIVQQTLEGKIKK